MKQRLLHQYISYLLLFAIQFAAIPFQQLFHKHQNIDNKNNSVNSHQLKKFEKPCCKTSEAITGTIVNFKPDYTVTQPFIIINTFGYSVHFSKPFFHFSNKAPPVQVV